MKLLLFLLLFLTKANAFDIFIEPGVFVDMFDSESIRYDNGTEHFSGTLRNRDLSYAMKFGVHYGKFEFGLESEVYSLVAHFKGNGKTEGFSKEIQITYNSFFIGYEFIPKHFFYLSVSNTPYLTSGTESYEEEANVFSIEYSYHLKEWVSVNLKVESASKLENRGSNPLRDFEYKDLVLVGFSFPLSTVNHNYQ